MTRVRFIFKLLIAMLAPALLAFSLWMAWSKLFPKSFHSEDLTFAEIVFGFMILGLLLLSIVLPILLTIRSIQNESSVAASISPSSTSTDKLWK